MCAESFYTEIDIIVAIIVCLKIPPNYNSCQEPQNNSTSLGHESISWAFFNAVLGYTTTGTVYQIQHLTDNLALLLSLST